MYAEDDPHRPGDVRVPGGGEDGLAQALDITIGDPTCATYMQAGSAVVSLTAAKALHEKKMQKHRALLQAVGGEPTFEFVPLTFELTGAMGPSTQKWWKGIMQIVKAREEGLPSSRREQGEEFTWSANSFATYWLQSISMVQARCLAENVNIWICENENAVGAA